jgi:hypothetical protein
MDERERRMASIKAGQSDVARWSDARNLETAWEPRAVAAGAFVPVGARVLDVGCGSMHLERSLPFGCTYQPCDIVARDARTLVVDLNAGQLPDAALKACDVVVMLGVWEYLFDIDALMAQLARAGKTVVCSYCDTGLTHDVAQRRALGWVNDLSVDDFRHAAEAQGYEISAFETLDGVQRLFRLEPRLLGAVRPCRVHVIAYNNLGNFGDRLGYHLVNEILPPAATVTWGHLRPFDPVPAEIDLLVVGIGNSLYGDLVDAQLVESVAKARAAIGIFGTQYRDAMPTQMFDRLVSSLTHWYARYEEDVLLYGRGRENVSHLGDWLINMFPMAVPTRDQPLRIGAEALTEPHLDRMIQHIQLHKRVFSSRLHPLLCALTSAEQVAYAEQREMDGLTVSGKFRSLLNDVFSRSYPERVFWGVDRMRVALYKQAVRERTDAMRAHIASLLS